MIASAHHSFPEHPEEPYLQRTWNTLCRRWKQSAAFFAVVMALVVTGVLVCPKTYQSDAKLFVRMGRESVTLDPTATTGQVMSVYESRENEINSVLEVIRSRVVLDGVVARLGPTAILSGRLADASPSAGAAGNAESSPADGQTRERAIRQLERTVQIGHIKKSSVITVACKAASPELAQQIVRELLDAFDDLHLKVNRTAGSREFFMHQKTLVGKRLATATLELRAVKNELGITTLENRRKTLQELIRNNRTAAQANAAARQGINSTIASLTTSLEELPRTLVAAKVVGVPNSAADRALAQLNTLRIRERELLTQFTEFHPNVITLRQQIAAAERIVARQSSRNAQSTTASNPTMQQLHVRLLTERARAESLASKARTLADQHAALLVELRTLNQHEGRLTRLQQDVARWQSAFKAYSEKYEQARIDWAMGEERISNVNVVQPPTYVTKPVAPKKRLIVFLGAVVAGIGAIGFACFLEFRARPERTTQPAFPTPQRETDMAGLPRHTV
ncbi:MAG: GumC family protein [Planctomycetaceae bacterium]